MGNTAKQKLLWQTHSASMVVVFAHLLSEVMTKHNIKETASKGNIWGPFYIPKGEVSGGG